LFIVLLNRSGAWLSNQQKGGQDGNYDALDGFNTFKHYCDFATPTYTRPQAPVKRQRTCLIVYRAPDLFRGIIKQSTQKGGIMTAQQKMRKPEPD